MHALGTDPVEEIARAQLEFASYCTDFREDAEALADDALRVGGVQVLTLTLYGGSTVHVPSPWVYGPRNAGVRRVAINYLDERAKDGRLDTHVRATAVDRIRRLGGTSPQPRRERYVFMPDRDAPLGRGP